MLATLRLDTSPLFKDESCTRAIEYNEVNSELLKAYYEAQGIEEGKYGVEMSIDENPVENSLYKYWTKVYFREMVLKHTGETLDQFLDKPRWKIDMILEEIKAINKEEARIAQELKDKKLNNPGQ